MFRVQDLGCRALGLGLRTARLANGHHRLDHLVCFCCLGWLSVCKAAEAR